MTLTISIDQIEGGNYRAQVVELQGCCAYAWTPEDALRELGVVLADYVDIMREDGETLAAALEGKP